MVSVSGGIRKNPLQTLPILLVRRLEQLVFPGVVFQIDPVYPSLCRWV
jgi:hypothetical protein